MKQTLSLLLFTTVIALAFIPLVAAQDTNALTEGATNLWNTITALPGQASEYVSTHVLETGAIGGLGIGAGTLGVAYKSASKAKDVLSSQVSGLKGKIESVTNQATQTEEQLTKQLTEQTSSVQNQIKAATEKATATVTSQSEGKILDLTNLNNTLNQQKIELQNQYKTLETRYNELKSIKSIP
jgi:hypothetical protein